jgi:hypothetical protein
MAWKLEYDKDQESAFKGNGNTYKDAARNEELERLVRVPPRFIRKLLIRK